jgi:hypothetical protein
MTIGEIVLRDRKEIVCVLCPGTDKKIQVLEDIENGLTCADTIAGIEAEDLQNGIDHRHWRSGRIWRLGNCIKDPVRIVKQLCL